MKLATEVRMELVINGEVVEEYSRVRAKVVDQLKMRMRMRAMQQGKPWAIYVITATPRVLPGDAEQRLLDKETKHHMKGYHSGYTLRGGDKDFYKRAITNRRPYVRREQPGTMAEAGRKISDSDAVVYPWEFRKTQINGPLAETGS